MTRQTEKTESVPLGEKQVTLKKSRGATTDSPELFFFFFTPSMIMLGDNGAIYLSLSAFTHMQNVGTLSVVPNSVTT